MTTLEIILLIFVILLFVGLGVTCYIFFKSQKKPKEENMPKIMESFGKAIQEFNTALGNQTEKNTNQLLNFERALKSELDKMNEKVENRITDLNSQVNKNIIKNAEDTSNRMEKIAEQIGLIKQAQGQIGNIHADITELQKVLQGNQTRGQYGERTLSLILHNVFGDTKIYDEQYTIATLSGEKVKPDAVVFCPEPYDIICIDSKFPFVKYEAIIKGKEEDSTKLVNEFEKDVKNHIDAVSTKYIIKGKTAPFAFLFIPNDAIFMFLHSELSRLVDYAERKKVTLTSPSTLYPFLSTIYTINIDYRRSKNIQKMMESFEKVFKEFTMLTNSWDSFKTTLVTFQKKVEEVDSRITRSVRAIRNIEGIEIIEETENIIESK